MNGSESDIVTVTTTTADTLTVTSGVTDLDTTSGTNSATVTLIARAQNPVCRTSKMTDKINVYSFALKPEEHQPSGTCNFSRIDTAILDIQGTGSVDSTNFIYAVNYNVLRIMSGMGGLAYSN